MKDDEIEDAIIRFRAMQALAELKRRYPGSDSPPCPDCGSMKHFECDGTGKP